MVNKVSEKGRLPFQSDAILETGRIVVITDHTENGRFLFEGVSAEKEVDDSASGTDELCFFGKDGAEGTSGKPELTKGVPDTVVGGSSYEFPRKDNAMNDTGTGEGELCFLGEDTGVSSETEYFTEKTFTFTDSVAGSDDYELTTDWRLGDFVLDPPPETFDYKRGELVGIMEQTKDVDDEEQFLGRQITQITIEGWMFNRNKYDNLTPIWDLQTQVNKMNAIVTSGDRVAFQRPDWTKPILVAVKDFEMEKVKGEVDAIKYRIVLVNEGYDE